MEVDQPIASGSNENEQRILQRVERAERAFLKFPDQWLFLQRVTRQTLQRMCQNRGLSDIGHKIDLYAHLEAWVNLVHPTTRSQLTISQRDIHHPHNDAEQPTQMSRGVLGKDVLQEVWADMKLTELPSWMSPAPPNWGTAARGKLTADQWMVVCTVHLPITMIRLWGHLQDRRFSLLCNFMDLTSSVQLADQRVVNEQTIQDLEMLMSRYLRSMKTLFKDTKVQPIHHAALHAGDFLRLFGPNHSVRAFGGERYLGYWGCKMSIKSQVREHVLGMTHHISRPLRGIRGDLHVFRLPQLKPSSPSQKK